MSGGDATRLGKPGGGKTGFFNSNQIIPKYAAYGKLLAERKKHFWQKQKIAELKRGR